MTLPFVDPVFSPTSRKGFKAYVLCKENRPEKNKTQVGNNEMFPAFDPWASGQSKFPFKVLAEITPHLLPDMPPLSSETIKP